MIVDSWLVGWLMVVRFMFGCLVVGSCLVGGWLVNVWLLGGWLMFGCWAAAG